MGQKSDWASKFHIRVAKQKQSIFSNWDRVISSTAKNLEFYVYGIVSSCSCKNSQGKTKTKKIPGPRLTKKTMKNINVAIPALLLQQSRKKEKAIKYKNVKEISIQEKERRIEYRNIKEISI